MEAGDAPNAEGLRERKHRETQRRIVESGMRLSQLIDEAVADDRKHPQE